MGIEKFPIKNNLHRKDRADKLLAEEKMWEKEQKEIKEKAETEKFLAKNKKDRADRLLTEAHLWLEERKGEKTKKEGIKETEESRTENLFKNFPKNDPHYDEIMPLTTETNDPTKVKKYLEANEKQLSPEAKAFLKWSIKQKEFGKKKREERENKKEEQETNPPDTTKRSKKKGEQKEEPVKPREEMKPSEKKEKEKMEEILKEFEGIAKVKRIERKDIEPDLDRVLKILKDEPESIRPKNKEGRPGGLVELKKTKPTILIPDLHGRREFLLKILKDRDSKGVSNLEKLLNGEIQIISLGDGMHSEIEADRWRRASTTGKAINRFMDAEIADSLGLMKMIMKIKELAPENFHYIRGNHDDIKETFGGFYKYANESTQVKEYVKEKFGSDFLEKYGKFESNLPLVILGSNFVVSHTMPTHAFKKEEVVNWQLSGQEKNIFHQFCWTRPDEFHPDQAKITDILQNLGAKETASYFYGHTHSLQGKGEWIDEYLKSEQERPLEIDILLGKTDENYVKVTPDGRYYFEFLDPESKKIKKEILNTPKAEIKEIAQEYKNKIDKYRKDALKPLARKYITAQKNWYAERELAKKENRPIGKEMEGVYERSRASHRDAVHTQLRLELSLKKWNYFSYLKENNLLVENGEQKSQRQKPEEKFKEQADKFLTERLVEDTKFFSKEVTIEDFRDWQKKAQETFQSLSKEKQGLLIKELKSKSEWVSNQIEKTKKEAKEHPDKVPKGGMKYLQNYQTAIRNRHQAYYLVLHPEKPPKKEKKPKEPQQTPEEELKAKKTPEENQEKIEKQFKEMLEDYKNGKGISSESFLTLMSNPRTGDILSGIIKNPNFQKAFNRPENREKMKQIIDQFQKFVKQNREKEKSTPEAVKKVTESIKKTSNKEKRSIWGTTGELIGGFVFLLFVVFAMLELKGIEELTGINIEGGKKRK